MAAVRMQDCESPSEDTVNADASDEGEPEMASEWRCERLLLSIMRVATPERGR